MTVPITTDVFHTRVAALLSDHPDEVDEHGNLTYDVPKVPELTAADTFLGPEEVVPKLLGIVSPWIDLCSPDPVVYGISRQVLEMEVAFASFCGLASIVLPTPKVRLGFQRGHGISQYAHAVQEVLSIGAFMQFSVRLPMWDGALRFDEPEGDSAILARPEFDAATEEARSLSSDSSRKNDFFGSWDTWNLIRSVCKYDFRLCVGKSFITVLSVFASLLRSSSFIILQSPRRLLPYNHNIYIEVMWHGSSLSFVGF